MKKVSIIGMGQMGGSIGQALKSFGSKYYIIGIGRNKNTLKAALKIGAADEVSLNISAVKGSDIVVICTPVNSIASIYKELTRIVDKKTIITDVGSVKEPIEKIIKSHYKKGTKPPFVAAHPMAGRERNGIASADPKMFENAYVIITGSIPKSLKNESIIAKMWEDIGAKTVKIPAKKHDELAAFTSHFPHIVAFVMNKIYKNIKKRNKEIDYLTAGSFKSMTRVSVSSADMWAPILSMNNKNVEKFLKIFIKELQVFQKALKYQNKTKKEILKTQK